MMTLLQMDRKVRDWQALKQRFYLGNELPAELDHDSPLIQAWLLSKHAGLSPDTRVIALEHYPHANLNQKDLELAALAQQTLADIWQLFAQQHICVFIINRQYHVIAVKHQSEKNQQYDFMKVGRSVDPAVFGAIAPNCSILGKQAVIMQGHQHYLNEFANFACASVPFFDGRGNVLGAIDITSNQGRLASNWLRHLLYQSYILENKIIQKNLKTDHYILYFQNSKDLLDTAYSGLIEVDAVGRVIKANQIALQLLDLSIELILAQQLDDLFDLQQQLDEKNTDYLLIQSRDQAYFYAKLAKNSSVSLPTQPRQQTWLSSSLSSNHQADDHEGNQAHVDTAIKLLKADIPVLVSGETGVGKAYLIQQIQQQYAADIPFICLNCASISADLIEIELWGRECAGENAAIQLGAFERVQDGILCLDEIHHLTLDVQVKILRVLQDRQFYRLGGRQAIDIRFKLICSSQYNLSQRIEQQSFRADLYYFIHAYQIELVPLRQRTDKLALFKNILRSLGCLRWHIRVEQQFDQYHWPGNIDELIYVIKLSLALNDGKTLQQLHLAQAHQQEEHKMVESGHLEHETRRLIINTLAEEQGNVSKAARRLNISRTTIYKYLKLS